ncbi:hypothetical protein ACE6H2_024465 [Prunus campanulata]
MLQGTQKYQESSCLTGNPIDDCWECDPNWPNNRQSLADCAIGFGQYALGDKGGEYYIVTDSSNDDAVNPRPGTLRYAVIQTEPLWIVFPGNILIKLSQELIFNSYETLDGHGANVHCVGGGCITLQFISNVIFHNVHIHHCYPSGGFSGNASSAPESRNCKFSSNVLIHAVDKLGSFLRKFPLFPNAFLVSGAENFFIIELADQLQKLKVEPAHKTSPGPKSLGIIVGIVFLVLGILFQYFNFTADSNASVLGSSRCARAPR